MALTPRTDEAFLREVDDNLRRDQMIAASRRWGPLVGGAVVLLLAALAIFLFVRDSRAKSAGRDGEQLSAALNDLSEGKAAGATRTLGALRQSSRDGYRGAAALSLAAEAAARNRPDAAAQYKAIANDDGLPQAYRDFALLRWTLLDFDKAPPAEVVARLRPLTVIGNAYFGTAAELTALAQLKLGRRAEAASLFAAVARAKETPQTLRDRADRMAGSVAAGVKG